MIKSLSSLSPNQFIQNYLKFHKDESLDEILANLQFHGYSRKKISEEIKIYIDSTAPVHSGFGAFDTVGSENDPI